MPMPHAYGDDAFAKAITPTYVLPVISRLRRFYDADVPAFEYADAATRERLYDVLAEASYLDTALGL